jgi:fibronectin-binding autotransporter adhesin
VLQATGGRLDSSNPTATNATFAGVISGVHELTKIGAGTMTLSGANTYAGGTILNGGTTAISADNNLGAAGTGVTFTGGTLRLDTPGTNFSRPITMTGNGGINNPGDATLSSVLTGNGNFTKSGNGRLTLTSSNPAFGPGGGTAGGRITVSAGTLSSPPMRPPTSWEPWVFWAPAPR